MARGDDSNPFADDDVNPFAVFHVYNSHSTLFIHFVCLIHISISIINLNSHILHVYVML